MLLAKCSLKASAFLEQFCVPEIKLSSYLMRQLRKPHSVSFCRCNNMVFGESYSALVSTKHQALFIWRPVLKVKALCTYRRQPNVYIGRSIVQRRVYYFWLGSLKKQNQCKTTQDDLSSLVTFIYLPTQKKRSYVVIREASEIPHSHWPITAHKDSAFLVCHTNGSDVILWRSRASQRTKKSFRNFLIYCIMYKTPILHKCMNLKRILHCTAGWSMILYYSCY